MIIFTIIIWRLQGNKRGNMVQYQIVRYTKEIISVVDGEKMAKTMAKIYAYHDDSDDYAWYDIEPYAVL